MIEDNGEEMKVVFYVILDVLLFLSENILVSVEVMNYFFSSGLLFLLLCFFCDVDLFSL